MRITNKSLTNNYLTNLSRNLAQMKKYQNQLSSGKEVSKSSDNPMLVSKIMKTNNILQQNEQFASNIQDSIGWVKTSDTVLGSVGDALNRARDLVIYGANGTLSNADRANISAELNMIVGEIAQSMNSTYDSRYIFGGQETLDQPYSVVDSGGVNVLQYNGDNNNITREIAKGVSLDIITDGSQVTDGNNLGLLLEDIINAMNTGDTTSLSGPLLEDLDTAIDNVLRVRSKTGATYNRLETAFSKNETDKLNLTELLSESEDIDIAEKYMEFSVMSSIYEASLSVGSKVLQPSLLDYLR